MHMINTHFLKTLVIGAGLALLTGTVSGCASNPPAQTNTENSSTDTVANDDVNSYNKYETTNEAVNFLGGSAEAIAKLMDKAFADYGRPNAYIEGEEAGGSFVFGVRYGKGELITKSGQRMTIYWQGPSLGWDFGADAGRMFILVYNLPQTDLIFQRFAGVNGSLYFVGGVGMDYLRSQNIVIAPMRVGVGMRLGAAVGYIQFTRDKSYLPF